MRGIKRKSLSKEVVYPRIQSKGFLTWKAEVVLKKTDQYLSSNHFRAQAQKDLRNYPHLKLLWIQMHTS